MAITLDPVAEAAITKALADRDAASQADADHATSLQALVAAEADEEAKKNASLTDHQIALDSAHAAIDALTAMLNASSTPTPPTPTTPPTP